MFKFLDSSNLFLSLVRSDPLLISNLLFQCTNKSQALDLLIKKKNSHVSHLIKPTDFLFDPCLFIGFFFIQQLDLVHQSIIFLSHLNRKMVSSKSFTAVIVFWLT